MSSFIYLNPNRRIRFLYWGFFSAIFEQKEYGEAYVLEKLAREMLAKDANLKKELKKIKRRNFRQKRRARLTFSTNARRISTNASDFIRSVESLRN